MADAEQRPIAVVTGATTGLGLETARALAADGVHVVLTARTAEKGDAAVATVRDRVTGAAVEHLTLELASLASVREFAREFAARHDALQLLVNNAGVMYTPFERTADGFELQFGTNHLGHFALTALLMPRLLAGAPARVVNLSSAGHRASDVLWDDPNFERHEYDKFAAYGQSKTANVLFTTELERRYGARGVHAYAVHPGVVATELARSMTREDLTELGKRARRMPGGGLPKPVSVEVGAATTVWAATAPELDDHGGAYLADCAVSDEVAPWARDPAAARRLWDMSEQLTGTTFPA
jgi:NAD(P)-dependent dehydrogenase (short-subunit alcohol dehydrogenase family)